MQPLHILSLNLDIPTHRNEIGAFRSRVAEAVGFEQTLFHNHKDGAADKYHYRYPLIQYKVQGGKAMIVGLGAGAQALRNLIDPGKMLFADSLPVAGWKESSEQAGIIDQLKTYSIWQWLPLNQENYQRWLENEDPDFRTDLLERILAAHLLAFCEGIGYTVPRPRGLHVSIESIGEPRAAKLHDFKVLSFDARFQCNLQIPNHVGIGRASSHGFGSLVGVRATAGVRAQEPVFARKSDDDEHAS
ncbi:MAG: hypothetical protein IT270_13955 [Saprospiraceae bacterium]|nr:hypothetical protein [Saprospiraceae bacterium]